MMCSAPHRSFETASCRDVAPRPTTLRDRVVADPTITLRMAPDVAICAVPPGALVAVTYTKRGGERDVYIGRVVAASGCGGMEGYVVFQLLCLNRGVPGEPEPRTFSTKPTGRTFAKRAGVLHAVRLLELPGVEPRTPH